MKKSRILIVEDEAITAADLKHQLVAHGYEVVGIAGTTSESVRLAAEEKPDLVLMDITLAGELDGVSAALVIRGTYDLPVVFLTAHADSYTIQRATLAGAFGYLLKPFEGAELKATIEVAIHKHQTEVLRKE
jgi:AmiR/NasT family two-component response regulator